MNSTDPTSYVVGLIGAEIGPSLSPALHEREADELGLRYVYRRIDIAELGLAPEDVGELVAAARQLGFGGLNITHPCKQLVVEHLDELSPDAEALGAVNTVVFSDGSAIGHNTDWPGFQANFTRGLPDVDTDRVVLVGAGGAGAAVAHATLSLGARGSSWSTPPRSAPTRLPRRCATATAKTGRSRRRSTTWPGSWPRRTASSTPRRPACRRTTAPPSRPSSCTRRCGSRTSSTGRSRPSCCATPGAPAAARSTAAAWPSSRPRCLRPVHRARARPRAHAAPLRHAGRRHAGARMLTGIATVCLSGTLEEKLAAASHAGFDGVEVFENDLIGSPLSPPEVRAQADALGLGIDLYQPFRDFEAVTPDQLERNLRRAEAKFDVMEELGAT